MLDSSPAGVLWYLCRLQLRALTRPKPNMVVPGTTDRQSAGPATMPTHPTPRSCYLRGVVVFSRTAPRWAAAVRRGAYIGGLAVATVAKRACSCNGEE